MENIDKIIEFAPAIAVIMLFFVQNNLFVKPERLEEKHRKILQEMDEKLKEFEEKISRKYVEVNAYKEFQNHIYSELEKVNSGINNLTAGIDDVKSVLMKRRKDD